MNFHQLNNNLNYKLSNPPFIRNIINGIRVSYTIKITVLKKTKNEIFRKLHRYDYSIINNEICNMEYFIINDTTYIGEMNDNCLFGNNCDY